MSNNQIPPLTNVTNHVPAATPQPPIYASFKRRLVATLVDGLFLLIIGCVIRTSLGIEPLTQLSSVESIEAFTAFTNSGITKYSNLISFALIFLYYFIFYVYFDGATPGKKILGMKLVKADGKPVNFATVLVRFLFSYVSSFCFLLGYIWTIFDAKKQTWHDKVAGTYVVHSGKPAQKGLGIVLAILSIISSWIYVGLIVSYGLMLYSKSMPKEQSTLAQKELSPEVKIISKSVSTQFKLIRDTEDQNARTIVVDALISELKDSLVKYPNEPLLWDKLASAYTWSKHGDALNNAAEAAKKSIELDPNVADSYYSLGQIYLNQEKYSEAAIELKKSIRLNDNDGYAHIRLGDAYRHLGIAADARIEYQKGIDILEKFNKKGTYDSEILNAKKSMATLK